MQEDILRVKRAVIRKYPIFAGIALNNMPIEADNEIGTACVWGTEDEEHNIKIMGIKYNPEFFDLLTFDQKVFVLAHETCHIAFKHFERSKKTPIKDALMEYEEFCKTETNEQIRKSKKIALLNRYNKLWNIATDACINAFLENDGLNMPRNLVNPKTGEVINFIDIKDGLKRNAEKIYESLKKQEQEQKKDNESNKDSKQSDDDSGYFDDIDIDNYEGIDSHDQIKKQANKYKDEKTESDEKKPEKIRQDEDSIDESKVFDDNKKEVEKRKSKSMDEALNSIIKEQSLSELIPPKPVVSWKQLLIKSLEEEYERYGYRRAGRTRPNSRIETRVRDEKAISEVILDTSGSISDSLLINFLKQLIPLLKETEIKVGCFAGEFHGFEEIKSNDDILNYKAKRDRAGTNFEACVKAFSKDTPDKRINKIVFTDGENDGYEPHVQRTRVDGILWLVFGDKMNFKPLGGKIIRISDLDLNQIINIEDADEIGPKIKGV